MCWLLLLLSAPDALLSKGEDYARAVPQPWTTTHAAAELSVTTGNAVCRRRRAPAHPRLVAAAGEVHRRDLGQAVHELVADLLRSLGCLGFKARGERRLRIGSAHQPPAIV